LRDKLQEEIMLMLMAAGIDGELIKSKLTIILNSYDVTSRCTEVAVVDENDITKYIKLFLISKRVSGRTERTIKQYKGELTKFFGEVQKSPLDITSDDIKLFLATKEVRDGASKVYQQNMLRVISSFYTWMLKEEYILKNPMNKVDDIKIAKIKKHAFTELEIEVLRNKITDVRDRAILEILLSTWCRVSEVEGMNRTDIDGDKLEVLGKGQKTRIVYLNAKAKVAINEYLKSREDDNEAIFVSKDKPHDRLKKSQIEALMRRYGRECGIEKCHPHRFRRTGATFALRRGMPIEQVSKILGHESIETTQIYLDISEQELAQAHRKYV
jgi:site-specific recombinase XerD